MSFEIDLPSCFSFHFRCRQLSDAFSHFSLRASHTLLTFVIFAAPLVIFFAITDYAISHYFASHRFVMPLMPLLFWLDYRRHIRCRCLRRAMPTYRAAAMTY